MLDEGHLTDNYGRLIDFKNTVVIMTSNVGARDIMTNRSLGFHGGSAGATFEKMQETVREEMQKTFNPEFLNRLDDVIVFHPLEKEHIAQIVKILLREVQRRLGDEVRLTQAALDFLVEKGFDKNYGARSLRRSIQRYIEDPLSERILLVNSVAETRSRSTWPRGRQTRLPRPDGLGQPGLTQPRRRPFGGAAVCLSRMRRFIFLVVWPLLMWAASPLNAQDAPVTPAQPAPIDSIEVVGASRVPAAFIISATGLVIGQRPSPRDIQRAIAAVYRSGGFDDVKIDARLDNGKNILVITVVERPLLASWTVVGASKIPIGTVRDQVKLLVNRPVDRVAIAHGQFSIDSLYRSRGYYSASVTVAAVTAYDGRVDVTYTIVEGERVAIAMVEIEGEKGKYTDGDIVKHMGSQPEGFWWWQKGAYDEEVLEGDIRERLPAWYASKGYIDFQVVNDSLIPAVKRAKATLRLTVDEGPLYTVGTFDMIGNRQYSTDELMQYYPFGPVVPGGAPKFKMPFDRSAWEKATEAVQNLYANTGYIYAQVVPEEIRKTGADGQPVVELRWNIREGNVVTVNKINIVGNEVTHERVIREAIVLYPGQVFSREALIRSWQNIANLGFFQQPAPTPDVVPSETHTEVDITFRVEEKHTGNINFGASLGQGTGILGVYRTQDRTSSARASGQAAVAVRAEHPGPEPVYPTRTSGSTDLGYALGLRFPGPLRGGRPRPAAPGGRPGPVRLPAARRALHPAVPELRPAGHLLFRRVDRPSGPIQLCFVHALHPWGVHSKGHPGGVALCDGRHLPHFLG